MGKMDFNLIVRTFCKYTFNIWQTIGIHVTPVHFYQPIPDTKELNDSLWQNKSPLKGIDLNENNQLKLLNDFLKYKEEYDKFPASPGNGFYGYYSNNQSYGAIDAEVLYCMIRRYKPKRIVEIGSGYSTCIAVLAINQNKKENADYNCELFAIEPYPNEKMLEPLHGQIQLIKKPVQCVDLSLFKKLGENDILFIDSSHVLKIASDVQYEYLEILPVLNKGVIIHIHDIFLPYEYPKEWVLHEQRFWNEQYILQSFLMFNSKVEILWASYFMNSKYREQLSRAFRSYRPDETGSFWMKML